MKIGVLGAGQLARMLALAGYPLGARFRFLGRGREAPAGPLGELVIGDFSDPAKIAELAQGADVLTFDVENIPADAVRAAGAERLCRPGLLALETGQDRLAEKSCFEALGIPVAPWRRVDSRADLDAAVADLGLPFMLKARRLGYDGRGQRLIRKPDEAPAAFAALGARALIAEAFVAFDREVSMLGVRAADGTTAFYPLCENQHTDGILRVSRAPAADAELSRLARDYVGRLLARLEYVGVLAVEFFLCDGRLLANEMAPRVHNSGHWTIEGTVCSQFENHLRAVLGLPLGLTTALGNTAMVNLIGEMPDAAALLAIPGLHLHSYGKDPRPGRKLGHATLVADDPQQLAGPL
ncbi:MAG TPA: 5-(carboxyamino)imidazole ribonucleotide synthase, partial [Gammaproteobacteria bacterium]|nr:5-(carboxyamino)imidazole ribonucleotide synthase [Gammaproteobacteria bacterium]